MTPRQKKRTQRFQSIRETTLKLIMQNGVHGFSMHKLANEIGLTTGALYLYYDSKDRVMVDVQCDVLDDFLLFFRERIEETTHRKTGERIALVLRAFLDLADAEPEKFQLIHHFSSAPEAMFDADVVGPAIEKMLELLSLVSEQIQIAQDEKVLTHGDPLHRTVVAWSMLQGITERRKLSRFGSRFNYDDLVQETIRTLLAGWGAKHAEQLCMIS